MSTLDYRHLPEERLATTDEEGRRQWIIPTRVRGVWKTRKTIFHIFLLLLFVLTPWLRINGDPIILLDLAHRQFVFFGKAFGAHDAPILFFVFGILGFGLIISTVLWGRVWCGWACPQTVFIEQIFRRIEYWVVGPRSVQVACHKNPYKPKHFIKLLLKWFLFTAVSIFLAHTFISYFVSWELLLGMMQKPPSESWTTFLFVGFFSAFILFDFAWFREQFCIIMCPYGRFQAVLLDESSTTIAYDHKRGEPRAKNIKEEGKGDCIDCYKCVSVCPTGIDIRRGQQLECIGCTACIDACDEVMTKIDRPKGLIRYASLDQIEGKQQKFWNTRLGLYSLVMLLFIGGLVYKLSVHQEFYVSILRQNLKTYSVTQSHDQEILINNFRMHLKNSTRQKAQFEVTKLEPEGVTMAPPQMTGELEPNNSMRLPFFVNIPLNQWAKEKSTYVKIRVRFKTGETWSEKTQQVKLVGPK